MANLLLIESPGKVKKLGQILGTGWINKVSMGHVRELANDGWDALGFDMEADRIACRYQPRDARSKKVLSDLSQAVKKPITSTSLLTRIAKVKPLAGICSRHCV
jgi:DNA topoisomerase-1